MKTKQCIIFFGSLSACLLVGGAALAGPVTDKERQFCRPDYERYCKDYGLGTEGLRACMSRAGKKLSSPCVDALVDAGEISRAAADHMRHGKPEHRRSTHKARKAHKTYRRAHKKP